jgi:hypothetical protein
MPRTTAKAPPPKPDPEPRQGTTRQVQLSVYPETEGQLDYLCRRVAARQGGNPARLRSPVVRALIAAEYRRERGLEEQERRAPR